MLTVPTKKRPALGKNVTPLALHALFSDHAVLQQGEAVRIFGSGTVSGEVLHVSLGRQNGDGVTNGDGTWEVELPAMPPGGPHRLVVRSGGIRLVRQDIYIGEVWLCSGQSNMQYTLREWSQRNGPVPEASCDSLIRYFSIAESAALEPCDAVSGCWQFCEGETIDECSALACFFAGGIRGETGVAVGVIVNALGDTEVASWMPRAALEKCDVLHSMMENIPTRLPDPLRPRAYEDVSEFDVSCADPHLDDSGWTTMRLPGMWQLQGHRFSGSAWFRRTLEIPEAWEGRNLVLEPGVLDDYDTTYFDGIEVGRTGSETKDSYAKSRTYRVPGALVHSGLRILAMRIFDACSLGGVNGPPGQMRISPEDNPSDQIVLAGDWRFQCDRALPWLWSQSPAPTLLFNAMVNPLARYRIRGVFWYQGESDRIRAARYKDLLAAMVAAWRSFWGYCFPFYIVQLANFMDPGPEPEESLWAELREAQRLAAEEMENSGLVTTIDAGEADNIHPKDKQTVGHRMAALALAKVYGRNIPFSGPAFAGYVIEGTRVRILFSHADGLQARGFLRGFAIAGRDRVFRWGEAKIEGESLVVEHPDIPAPLAVRYAWQDNPPSPLVNALGLPASPFRTDNWPWLSDSTGI